MHVRAGRKERERFMRQAITQAKKAEKLMEVPIGCVIVYEDTTLSQIIQMVSDAAATKAPIAKIADRVSGDHGHRPDSLQPDF